MLIIFFQGWMNETHSYNPETFHPSITHSVYVTLEGSQLRLGYPRANIPRWASFDEALHEASFLRSRTYQLANCKVSVFAKQIFSFLGPRGAGMLLTGGLKDSSKVTSLLNSSLSSLCTRIVI